MIDLSPSELDDALSQLVQSGLLLRRGSASQPIFAFRHALVQDAAYTTLRRSRRQQLHARIAGAFRDRLPQRVETEPELLARHYQEAGLIAEAADYSGVPAGGHPPRAANIEAIEHLQHALAALRTLPATAERDAREIDLLIALGIPLIAARGYAAPPVIETYEAA